MPVKAATSPVNLGPHRREAFCPLAERTLHATANRGSIRGRVQIGTHAFSFDHLVGATEKCRATVLAAVSLPSPKSGQLD